MRMEKKEIKEVNKKELDDWKRMKKIEMSKKKIKKIEEEEFIGMKYIN
jgi:hypothetical protein